MLNNLRVKAQSEKGFTLVELLVVMLILGLLAAIAVPAFFNQRDKANDSEAKTQAKTAQTAIETFATDNGGSYAAATNAGLIAIEPTISAAVDVEDPAPGASTYTITATADNTGNTYSIVRAANGTVTYPCTVADATQRGGCPTTNFWN
jgi:type IV pilus assembly protein PilA